MTEVPKKKVTRTNLNKALKLYEYIKPFKVEYLWGTFFLVVSSVASLAFKLMGNMINTGTGDVASSTINQTLLLLVFIIVLQSVFSYFRVVLFVNVTEKTMASLRRSTYNHIIKLPLQFFEKRRVGELNSRISADITLLQETLTTTLAEFVRQVIIVVGGIILLAVTSGKLTLFTLAILPPIMIMARFFGRYIRTLSKEVQQQVADSNTMVEETMQGIQSVKAFTNEWIEMGRYKTKTDEIATVGMKSGKYRGAFFSFVIFGLFSTITAVVWQGSKLMAAGEMTSGDLFSFILYSVFVGGTIGGLATVFTNIQKFIGATHDLFELFDEAEEAVSEVSAIPSNYLLKGNITFKDLNFTYPSRPNEPVLKGINLTITSNEMVAIVGASGAGKSTLASLLLMLHYPTPNELYFDALDSHDIPLSILRSQISLVPQDIFLFGGSIKENIAYGRPTASDADIIAAAEKANVMEFVNRFPEGLDTIVGERGTQLSGGQRQRVAIARAVLKNPRILILDEATSSLDSESERLVQDALERLMVGRTSIVIAHRLSTIRKANNIVVIDQGKVVEQGTHDVLIGTPNGMYKKLSEMQFSV